MENSSLMTYTVISPVHISEEFDKTDRSTGRMFIRNNKKQIRFLSIKFVSTS